MSRAESLSSGGEVHLAELNALQQEIHQLRRALVSRTVIGQAEGIVMSRLDVDAARAMAYLKRVSSTSNRKLLDIAAEIVAARRLPEID